jgi:hypothetical protein
MKSLNLLFGLKTDIYIYIYIYVNTMVHIVITELYGDAFFMHKHHAMKT